MRRVLAAILVGVSLGSAIGLAYFHYNRHDCESVPGYFGDNGKYYYDGPMTKDWQGNCVVTFTVAQAIGEPFKPKARVTTATIKWVSDPSYIPHGGYWKTLSRTVRID